MSRATLLRGDVLVGLFLMAVGGAALWLTLALPIGSLARMGSGYAPRVLAFVLIGFGVAILARGLISGERIAITWGVIRPGFFIAAAIFAFAMLIERAGLVPACLATITLAAFADRDVRPREVPVIALIAAAVAAIVFVKLLGLNFALWPR